MSDSIKELYFFDVDYTLFSNMYNDSGNIRSVVPHGNKDIESGFTDYTKYLINHPNSTEFIRPIKAMQYLVKALSEKEDTKVYAITAAGSSFDYNRKVKLLKKYYPDINELIMVNSREMKLDIIDALVEKTGLDNRARCYLIDDDLTTIIHANFRGIATWHTTDILFFLYDVLEDYRDITRDAFTQFLHLNQLGMRITLSKTGFVKTCYKNLLDNFRKDVGSTKDEGNNE